MMLRASILLLLCVGAARADDLRLAEEAWSAGRTADAVIFYERALDAPGADAGYLHFRLGCCAYRQERWAVAVHHFRRALLRRPRDERVRFNLDLAARQLDGTGSRAAESSGPERAWSSLTVRERMWLAALLQLTGLVGVLALRRVAVLRAAAVVVLLAGLAVQARVVTEHLAVSEPALVLVEEAPVRVDPHPSAATAFALAAGDAVVVLESSDRWARVRCVRGEGWMERAAVGVID